MRRTRMQNGITLIVLIIIIIVILILALVSISTLTGNEGILTKVVKAKEVAELAREKEMIELAVINANIESKPGRLEENLKNELETGAKVKKVGKNFLVTLKNKNQYKIYCNGEIEYYDFKPMTSTSVFGKLDDDGILYLRSNNPDGSYRNYTNSSSITSEWNNNLSDPKVAVLKVKIEEPIAPNNGRNFFNGFSNLIEIENIKNLHTENMISMESMFYNCQKITELDVSDFDTSNSKEMNCMFWNCINVKKLDVSWFDTSQVSSMSWMFSGCRNINKLDLSNFDTSGVTTMKAMFGDMKIVETIDVTSFDTSQVTSMEVMFGGCEKLEKIDVSKFSVENCTNISKMFDNCSSIKELDLSSFNTNKLTKLQNVFKNCASLEKINLNNLDTSNIVDTQNLFLKCTSLKELNLKNWDTRNVTAYAGMFLEVKAKIKLGPNWNYNIMASNTGYNGTLWNI